MTTAQASAFTVAMAAAFGLGVWTGPHLRTPAMTSVASDAAPIEAPTAADASDAKAPVQLAPAAAARHMRDVIAVDEPKLHHELQPLLYQGTDMSKAAEGFSNAEQFATVAYASFNTRVPFVVLKYRVLNEGRTLTSAIRESQPAMNATLEVERARAEARSTLASIGS